MLYLDNAATSFPKPACVLKEINFCLKKYCGNPGRSSHTLSVKASEAIYSAREKIAKMLGVIDPEHIVFTYNATYALNIAIKSLVRERCHILTSDFEHNSVIRPLEALRKKLKIEYSCFDTKGELKKSLQSGLRQETSGIIASLASNVTGDHTTLKLLSDFAKEKGLFLIVDASQAIGHMKINLNDAPCDALCAPGHKALFGIQGCGFVYFKDKTRRESFIEGGSGYDSISGEMPILLPEGYEAGTLSTPAIASLSSGVDFIEKIGLVNIHNKLNRLTEMTSERLSEISGIRLYKAGIGLLSFNYMDMPSSAFSSLLNERGICVRGGLHCAPSIHKRLGTIDQGTVRVSYSYLNKMSDPDRLYKTVKSIIKEI